MAIAASPVRVPSTTRVDEHTRRIVAWRLLPFLFILYIVNYVDRTNLAYAALGMSRELGFSDHVFGLGAGIFFISYLALQIPGALLVAIIAWMASLTFLAYVGQYTFVFWFPTMLKRLTDFTDMRVGIVGVLPFLAAFVAMQLNGWHSDKEAERRWHSAMPLFVAGTAYFLLSIPGHSIVATIFLFTVAGVLTAYLSTFWAIPTEIMSHAEAATAVGLINAVGSVAGFAGPYIFGYVYIRTGASFSWGLRLVMTAVLIAGLMILRIPKAPKTATET